MNREIPAKKMCTRAMVAAIVLAFGGFGTYLSMSSDAAAPRVVSQYPFVVQGSSAPGSLYVWVTWDRADPTATGYEVYRDGSRVHAKVLDATPWDDLAYKDTAVTAGSTYRYQIVNTYGNGTRGNLSPAAKVAIRSNPQLGMGKVFTVDNYSGTDLQKAQAAVTAAKANGGGVVQFAARTYTFSGPLVVTGTNDVVLRGAGTEQTFIRPGFGGAASPGSSSPQLIEFTGSRSAHATKLTAAIMVGDRTVSVDSTAGLSPGQVFVFDQRHAQNPPTWFDTNNIIQDPGSGRDDRYRWDANEIVSVGSGSVTFKHPFSQTFTTAVPWSRISAGLGNGAERMSIEGAGAADTSFYRLVNLTNQARFTMAEVTSRWANQNNVVMNGYDLRFVGYQVPDAGASGYTDGISKYRLSVARTANFSFIAGVMGDSSHNRNRSFITTQWAQRSLVRQSRFINSNNYAFNEHGGGSRHVMFENNYISATTATEYGGVYLGNSTWGFSGSAILRNNYQTGGPRFLHHEENSYEIRVLDNVVENIQASTQVQNGSTTSCRFVYGEGWKGPDTAPELYGSLRMTVKRNKVTTTASGCDGVDLGRMGSNYYPLTGVKDVVIADNSFIVTQVAVRLQGTKADTKRFQVYNNTGRNSYIKPDFVSGDYWASNMDGGSYGTPTMVTWANEYFGAMDAGTPLAEGDTAAPTVSLTSPVDGSSVSVGSAVILTATAADNIGVSKTEFYDGTVLLATDTTSPYSYSWNTAGQTVGIKSLTAKAYDAAGNATISAVVSLKVTNATSTNGDINEDGRVNALDLSIFLSKDGQNYPPADFNADGTVGAADMAILLSKWTW